MPLAGSAEAVALGLALADRLPACLALMEERIQRIDQANPVLPDDFRQRERLTRQFALMLIGRWLVSREPASEEEAAGSASRDGSLPQPGSRSSPSPSIT
jgi:hypothetical protein